MTANWWMVEITYATEDTMHAPTALHMAVPGSAEWDYDVAGRRLELRCVLSAATLREATVSALSCGIRALRAADMTAHATRVTVSAIDEAAA